MHRCCSCAAVAESLLGQAAEGLAPLCLPCCCGCSHLRPQQKQLTQPVSAPSLRMQLEQCMRIYTTLTAPHVSLNLTHVTVSTRVTRLSPEVLTAEHACSTACSSTSVRPGAQLCGRAPGPCHVCPQRGCMHNYMSSLAH